MATILLALLIGSFSQAQMSANCHNEDTFLKINEIQVNEAGQRMGELYLNFKDHNRILNLPEVVLRQHASGLSILERNSKMVVLLNFTTPLMSFDQLEVPKQQVDISVSIEDQKIRERVKLNCDK